MRNNQFLNIKNSLLELEKDYKVERQRCKN